MMTIEQMKEWIDNASYGQLLARWRFAPAGSPWFQGELGDYYAQAMDKSRRETDNGECVRASKALG